jgi:gliding motility-associated protein GldE
LEPPSEPYFLLLDSLFNLELIKDISLYLLLIVLLVLSALISGSEVAFFSISPIQEKVLEDSESSNDKLIQFLLLNPKKLLATILISNNFVNIAIVVFSSFIIDRIAWLHQQPELIIFLIQVVIVTFLILLFGEVLPKVYATNHALKLARIMAPFMVLMSKVFSWASWGLITSTNFIDQRLRKNINKFSLEDLEDALEITQDKLNKEERRILKSIVKFGNTDAKQIMTARTQMKAFEYSLSFSELLVEAEEIGYSRIPVYKETYDEVVGVLYMKDLLSHINKKEYNWQKLIHKPFFVPENKKIDDLLKEFQRKKVHLAIVVDEYGGTSGIVSLEDIMEEVVGEITDEFDEEDISYSKIDDNVFIFDGSTALIDLYKVIPIDGEEFEQRKGEADTLAGFIIEQTGYIPVKNEKIRFKNYEFIIEGADKRRVKQVKLVIHPVNNKDE